MLFLDSFILQNYTPSLNYIEDHKFAQLKWKKYDPVIAETVQAILGGDDYIPGSLSWKLTVLAYFIHNPTEHQLTKHRS